MSATAATVTQIYSFPLEILIVGLLTTRTMEWMDRNSKKTENLATTENTNT